VQLIGHPGRLRMLDRFLTMINEHERARFYTCAELAAAID
jgi:hypothetical protein